MSINPMPAYAKGLQRLLDHPRCGAYCRTTGQPCRQPAMKNGRCHMHGGKSPGAPRGERHGRYKHGQRTKAAIEERQYARLLLRELKRLMACAEPT